MQEKLLKKKSSRKSFRRNAKLIMLKSRKLKAAALRFLTRFRRFRTKKTAALSFSALTRKMILRFVAFTMLLTLSRTFRNSACRWNLRLMLCVPRPHWMGRLLCALRFPKMDEFQKPCFYKGSGRLRGSFVRVGDSDRQMTEYEVYTYEEF